MEQSDRYYDALDEVVEHTNWNGPSPDDMVEDGDECPQCGEARADYLEWQADGWMVKCATCGHEYKPEQ